MNRRHFLGSLSALSAGMLLDPERALWVPGRKTYFDIVRPVPAGRIRVSYSYLSGQGSGHFVTKWEHVSLDLGSLIELRHPAPPMSLGYQGELVRVTGVEIV